MKKVEYIIDRFEGDYAVCETNNRKMVEIEISKLYSGAKVGDVFYENNNEYFFDEQQTKSKKNINIKLQNSLFEE